MQKLIVVFLALFGCVDPFVIEEGGVSNNQLAITGSITTLPGPQEIRVFQSGDINNPDVTSFPVRDAVVYVIDNLGNREDFTLTSDELQDSYCLDLDGTLDSASTIDFQTNYRYESRDDFSGISGQTYTLFVEFADGRLVESSPQYLKPAKPIKALSYEYVTKTITNNLGNESFQDSWEIKILLDELVQENYLTWRYRGTNYVFTNPELYCDYFDCSPPGVCIPQCCNECWITEYGKVINNFNPGVNTQTTNEVLAASIPITAQRTTSVYLVDLYQFHIHQDVYNYFESIENQLTNQGSIFDPPPYSVESNLSITDSEEAVLGYFWAAGVSHHTLEISPTSVTRQYEFFYPNDCQTIPGASTEKPDRYTF